MSGFKLVLNADNLSEIPIDQVLSAASAGFLGIDHRFLHAILDKPDHSLAELVRFAAGAHADDPVEIDAVLLDIFRYLKTPEAVPYLISLVRRDPESIDDDLVEALVPFGAALLDPLLELLADIEDKGSETSDVLFLLSQLRVRDPRILETFTRRLESGDTDAALFLDMYGDPAAIPALQAAFDQLPPDDMDRPRLQSFIRDLSAPYGPVEEEPEKFDIWEIYPKNDVPPIDFLEDEDRLLMLDEGTAELRAAVAAFYRGSNLSDQVAARVLDHARHDPDADVRGECWESLEDRSDEPEVRKSMLAILKDATSPVEEKGGVAVALAQQIDNPAVYRAIEDLYANPKGRAKAIKAMGRSFDKRFAEFPARHLDDADPAVKRQAIWAVGYLGLSSEAPRLEKFFEDDEFRGDALFAYALSVPGETSRGRIRSMLSKIRNAAGGFQLDERELVETALDQRLMLHGMKPVFSADDSEDPQDEPEVKTVESAKTGRNDPCPCGSGKKYKKCCGA